MAGMTAGYGTLLAVTNAAAGGTDDDRVAAAVDVLRASADVRVESCDGPDGLDRLLDDRGDRVLVLLGGDGSVHAAVQVLRRRGELGDVVLGLVPLGTGNDLARTLGIPLDPAEAAHAVLVSRPRPLDLVVDDAGGSVVNVVHLGIGAEAAARAAALKGGLGATAYAVGGLAAGVSVRGWDVEVRVDDQPLPLDGPALMVAVANGRTIGGGAELAPAARPDDGLLDVVVATSTGPLARLGFGLALRGGEHVARDDVVTARGRRVSVTGDPFPLNADGEVHGPVPTRAWHVEPRAWRILVPTSTDGSG